MAGKFPPVETLCSHFFVFPGLSSLGACSLSWHNLIRRPEACALHRSQNSVLWFSLELSPGSSCRVLGFPQPHFTTYLNSADTGKGLLIRVWASTVLGTELSKSDDSTEPPWWFCYFCHTLPTTDSPLPALHPPLKINVNTYNPWRDTVTSHNIKIHVYQPLRYLLVHPCSPLDLSSRGLHFTWTPQPGMCSEGCHHPPRVHLQQQQEVNYCLGERPHRCPAAPVFNLSNAPFWELVPVHPPYNLCPWIAYSHQCWARDCGLSQRKSLFPQRLNAGGYWT